jgi:hypothetical protein
VKGEREKLEVWAANVMALGKFLHGCDSIQSGNSSLKIRCNILSRIRVSVNNNNGFWIGWLDLLALLLQLLS